jgi:hypothetical protein
MVTVDPKAMHVRTRTIETHPNPGTLVPPLTCVGVRAPAVFARDNHRSRFR